MSMAGGNFRQPQLLFAYGLLTDAVLGENIGTTITANLAALTGNTQARRAALAHLVFNVFGVKGHS